MRNVERARPEAKSKTQLAKGHLKAARSDAAFRSCERGYRSADALRNTYTRSFTGKYLRPMLARAPAKAGASGRKSATAKEAAE
jgi:hypothetical protein